MVFALSVMAKGKLDVYNHDAYLGVMIAPYLGDVLQVEFRNGGDRVSEWVELEVEVIDHGKIGDLNIITSSKNGIFNQAVLKNLKRYERSIRAKQVDGHVVPSIMEYRYDILFKPSDNYVGELIKSEFKVTQSKQLKVNTADTKKLLIYFLHEVEEGEFIATLINHNQGDFMAVQVMKNLAVAGLYQANYAKSFGFNSLINKELLSYYEFFNAYDKYTNSPDLMIHDENRNVINPETYNEHRPLAKKTEFWTTRPKNAQPEFFSDVNLFSSYDAELSFLGCEGIVRLRSNVEPTGLLSKTELVETSGNERLDDIILKVLDGVYIKPAYQNFQTVDDEIEFEISFTRE